MRVLRKNIVVLVYAANNCHTLVVPLCEVKEGITVNCRDGLWFDVEGTAHQIGEHRHCGVNSVREGVIGVYNRSRPEQMDSMSYVVQEATAAPCPYSGSDLGLKVTSEGAREP